jgi:hypothetical protein
MALRLGVILIAAGAATMLACVSSVQSLPAPGGVDHGVSGAGAAGNRRTRLRQLKRDADVLIAHREGL